MTSAVRAYSGAMPSPHAPSARRAVLRAAAAPVLLAAVLLAGCSGGDATPAVTASPGDVPVLQPGKPGEPNATLTGPAATPVVTTSATPADTRFMQDMVVHHAQAIVLVDTASAALSDRQVASIASRIRDEQEPEIDAMAAWLRQRGQDVPPQAENPRIQDHSAHRGMPGMASEADLAALGAARGAEADRLFLRLMVRHHEGALEMVGQHARSAGDPRVEELAADINVTQAKQVEQMTGMLARLG